MANRNVSNVVTVIRGLRARAEKVAGNPELSEIGKQNQLTAIQKEAAAQRTGVLGGLKSDWQQARRESARLEKSQRAAEAEAAKSWDYAALNYEAQAARAAIRGMRDIGQLVESYQEAVSSGNRAKARAWAEIGPGEVQERFAQRDGMEANRLVIRMQKDAGEMAQTPEMKAIQAERSGLVVDALELLDATKEAGEYYDRHNWDLGEFGQLTKNVTVARKVDAASGGYITSVDIGPEPEEKGPVDFEATRRRLGLS